MWLARLTQTIDYIMQSFARLHEHAGADGKLGIKFAWPCYNMSVSVIFCPFLVKLS